MSVDPKNMNKLADEAAKQAVREMADLEVTVNKDVAANQEENASTDEGQKEKKNPGNDKKNWRPAKTVQGVLDGSFLTKGQLFSLIPFIFYVVVLLIIAIANTYYAEKMVRQIEQLKKDLKELRYEQITTRSELMYLSKQSEVARRLKVTGLKESTVPPEKIMMKSKEEPVKKQQQKP